MTNFETQGILKKLIEEETSLLETIQQKRTKILKTPLDVIENYKSLFRYKSSKQKKKNQQKQENIKEEYSSIEEDIKCIESLEVFEKKLAIVQKKKEDEKKSLEKKLRTIEAFLTKECFFDETGIKTILGNIASRIHHIPCLAISKKMSEIVKFEFEDLVSFLGCLIPINVPENKQEFRCPPDSSYEEVLSGIANLYHEYYNFEVHENIHSGEEYVIHYNFCDLLKKWVNTKTDRDCIVFLNEMKHEKGIFLGEFVKYIMNLNNLSKELENVAEYMGNMDFLYKLKQIPEKTMKFIVTNQSLYV